MFQVKVGDTFNQNICITCAQNLDIMYDFKSKAIACDLELSKDVHKDTQFTEQFTYIQVSDDPLNVSIINLCYCVINRMIYYIVNKPYFI